MCSCLFITVMGFVKSTKTVWAKWKQNAKSVLGDAAVIGFESLWITAFAQMLHTSKIRIMRCGAGVILKRSAMTIPAKDLTVWKSVRASALDTYPMVSFPCSPITLTSAAVPWQCLITPSHMSMRRTLTLTLTPRSFPCLLYSFVRKSHITLPFIDAASPNLFTSELRFFVSVYAFNRIYQDLIKDTPKWRQLIICDAYKIRILV